MSIASLLTEKVLPRFRDHAGGITYIHAAARLTLTLLEPVKAAKKLIPNQLGEAFSLEFQKRGISAVNRAESSANGK